ncbi:WbuC family cupin fold metalloprotein [Salmonella enterica subsp. enterica]|nr:WbuC family cupin fold metalloprotein [Salmonella enterica subsp. enterica]
MQVSLFTAKQMQELIDIAKKSERLRAHLSLHESHKDKVQMVLIALIKGTYIPPHFHKNIWQWEYFQIINGEVELYIFDENGKVRNIFQLGGKNGALFAKIEPNTIHTLICRSSLAVVLEVKEGPFIELDAKVVPCWAFTESYKTISREKIIYKLENLRVGQVYRI